MNAKVGDLMSEAVVTSEPHKSIGHVRDVMERNNVGVVPIVDSDGGLKGVVSAADLVGNVKPSSPVSTIMTDKVYTIPKYDDVSTAARVMRNHAIHHLVVTHEHRVVGVLSSFDLLRLVEGHRFVAKPAPTASSRKGTRRS